ncbi:MAG: hypothetical protein LC775_07455 [Acidobacteria bacterium]|nr:hypothetical protein [Acidobacteriota bacterium]
MELLIVLLALALIAVVILAFVQRRRAAAINKLLEATAPFLIRAGFPFGLVEQGFPFFRWEFVEKGGNTNQGVVGGFGNCPCQKDYTVATIQTNFAARPNAAQIAAATANPPAPANAVWPCKDQCINVMTHVWNGWFLLVDNQTGQFLLNSHTYAQWHCKLSNDPDVEKPPKETDPGGDIEP